MTGLGMCQIRPSSPPGAVSWAMAKPWVGPSLTTASTVHSGRDNLGHALMALSLEEPGTCSEPACPPATVDAGAPVARERPVSAPAGPVTGVPQLGSLFVTS